MLYLIRGHYPESLNNMKTNFKFWVFHSLCGKHWTVLHSKSDYEKATQADTRDEGDHCLHTHLKEALGRIALAEEGDVGPK
jgi:hypothetical protein